jgi:hypothetical protein
MIRVIALRPGALAAGARALLCHPSCHRWIASGAWIGACAVLFTSLMTWGSRGFPDLPLVFARGLPGVLAIAAVALVYATLGAILATRVRGNPIGWMLLSIGVMASLLPVMNLRVADVLQVLRPAPPETILAAWLFSSVAAPTIIALLVVITLVFPTGRPPAGQWWLAGVIAVAGVLLVSLALGLDPKGILWYPSLPNPFALPGSFAPLIDIVRAAGAILLLAGFLISIASLGYRYRCADQERRHQLHLIVIAAALAAIAVTPFLVSLYWMPGSEPQGELLLVIAAAGAVLVPLAIGIAVTRRRLFGTEAIITRSLAYLPLMAVSGGLFVASIALFQRLFVSVTGNRSDIAVVIATLIVGATFTTVRRGIDGFVDRRFKPHAPAAGEAGRPAGAAASASGPGGLEIQALNERLDRVEAQLEELRAVTTRTEPRGGVVVSALNGA